MTNVYFSMVIAAVFSLIQLPIPLPMLTMKIDYPPNNSD